HHYPPLAPISSPYTTLFRSHPAISLSPIVESRVADTRLATHFHDRCAFIRLAQDERDLRLRELRFLHGTLLLPSRDHNWKIPARDRKSTRLNSSHVKISYAV